MELNQISIKINQTTQSDGGKQKINDKNGGTGNSFDQLLAMFGFLNQSSADGENKTSTPLKSELKMIMDNDQTNLSPEDWQKIESLLLAFIQNSHQELPLLINENPKVPDTSPSDLHRQSSLAILSPLPQNDMQQKMTRPTIIPDSDKIQFAQVIQELRSLDNQKSFEIPKEVKNKISLILNDLNSENIVNNGTTDIRQPQQPLIADMKQGGIALFRPRLSLDKNQVDVSSSIVLDSDILDTNHLDKTNEMISVYPQSQSPSRNNVSNNILTPNVLSVSNFVPEVREWIGRFMRISEGQSGGTEAKFSLYPERLGPIEVKIFSQQGQVSAQIITDTSLAKEALQGQLHHLREALQQQGILVQKLDIVHQTQQALETDQVNLSFSQGGSSSSREQPSFAFKQELSKKQKSLNQIEVEDEPISITYGRTTPKSTSSIDFTA
ncbi:flagellar hook-length control protein FliK [Bacillus salipaludis]|uniref:flagellar hook-length control protein FliK n=1 Tax=Bacillus salipaludis TaxID=2547811 RepID=UPI003D20EEBA